MTKKAVVLFDNYDIDEKSTKKYLIERHHEDYPEDNDWEPSEEELREEAYREQEFWWEEIQEELNSIFSKGNKYLITGTAGTWRGVRRGGAVISTFNELCKAWGDCDYIKLTDENGRFYIQASHHDGTNSWELRKLTDKGEAYLERHEYNMAAPDLHEKLYKYYTVNPWIAKQI